MRVEVKVPKLEESIAEAIVGEWLKKPGDYVEQGEQIVDIETDKVILEVTAPESGELVGILKYKNEQVAGEEILAEIDTAKVHANTVTERSDSSKNENDVAETISSANTPKTEKAAEITNIAQIKSTEASTQKTTETVVQEKISDAPTKTSPAVRKLAAENKIDVNNIKGTGKGGRVTKQDVLLHMQKDDDISFTEIDSATEIMAIPKALMLDTREERRVPMTSLRKSIAKRLVASQHETAMLTTFNEVNMKNVIDLRQRYKQGFEESHGVKLGFMSFFIKAAVEGLKEFPIMNAQVDGDDIIYHNYFDIGVAVSTQKGLIVPVIRDVEGLSFAGIEQSISDYASRAQVNKITIEELTGGTFTITNGGVFGSMMSTPIINPPQSAILGMHSIVARPIADNGEVIIAPMMYLALSYDHRIIDGKDAVQYLVHIKNIIEDPARLLLQI